MEVTMKHSKTFVTGLVLAGLFALGDITTPLMSDGEHPPMAIAIADSILGLICAVAIVLAWRGSRGAVTAIIVTRLLSVVSALPALFVDGVPTAVRLGVGLGTVVQLVAVAMVATRLRRPAYAPAAS
jgi:hypothetical protein